MAAVFAQVRSLLELEENHMIKKNKASNASQLSFESSFEIVGLGSFVPDRVVTNEQLGIDCEWVKTRTGISERRHIDDGGSTKLSAMNAARSAIESSGVDPKEIGVVIVGTSTPDQLAPSTAASIQTELGLSSSWAFDVSAGCSGFLYALKAASSIIKDSSYDYALVVGAESFSRTINWDDEKSSVLFGDGAGAAVIKKKKGVDSSKDLFLLRSESDIAGDLSIEPPNEKMRQDFIQMNGREVFKRAVSCMSHSISQLMEDLNVEAQQVKHLIVHQANERILESVRTRLGFESHQVPQNISSYGNTGAASIPILLKEVVDAGHVEEGDLILFAAFGAGFTWGSAAFVW